MANLSPTTRLRQAVAADARRAREKKAEEEAAFRARKPKDQAEYFAQRYSQKKVEQFTKTPNMDRFVMLPHISELHGPDGGPPQRAALAVYPYLCMRSSFTDEAEWFQVSLANIAHFAGLSEPIASKGVRELLETKIGNRPVLQRKLRLNEGRRFYIYRVEWPRHDTRKDDPAHGNWFLFPGEIVDSGRWAQLRPAAQAFYLAAASESSFDKRAYEALEGIDLTDDEACRKFFAGDGYRYRRWHTCERPHVHLCRLAGIASSQLYKIKDELRRNGMIEDIPINGRDRVLKVILRPITHERDLREAHRREQLAAELA